ncbi:hypothetical protein ABFX02_09G100500 [Erythranthe guttata]
MEEERWTKWSSKENVCWPRSYSSLRYDRFVSYNNNMPPLTRSSSKAPIWMQLWRKLKREKKRIFQCNNNNSNNSSMRFTYDAYSYSQNFDDNQGSVWADPDNVSRSFSARFAVPSRIFEQQRLMMS